MNFAVVDVDNDVLADGLSLANARIAAEMLVRSTYSPMVVQSPSGLHATTY